MKTTPFAKANNLKIFAKANNRKSSGGKRNVR